MTILSEAHAGADPFRLSPAPLPDPVDALPWRIRPIARFLRKPTWTWKQVERVTNFVEEKLERDFAEIAEHPTVAEFHAMRRDFVKSAHAPWDAVMPTEPDPSRCFPTTTAGVVDRSGPRYPTIAAVRAKVARRGIQDRLEGALYAFLKRGESAIVEHWTDMDAKEQAAVGRELVKLGWGKVTRTYRAFDRFSAFVRRTQPARDAIVEQGTPIVAPGEPYAVAPAPEPPDTPDTAPDATTGEPGPLPDVPKCGRCQDPAETFLVTRHFGREHLCEPCAAAVRADGQCDGIDQDPRPDFPTDPPPVFSADEVIGRIDDPTDSAIVGRGRLARVEPPDLGWLARYLAVYVMDAVGRKRDEPARRDDPYWAWWGMMRYGLAREDFARFCDLIGFATDEDDGYSRFVRFVESCLAGSPVSFGPAPNPPGGPPGPSDRGDVDSYHPAPEDAATGLLDVSTLVVVIHGPAGPSHRASTADPGPLASGPVPPRAYAGVPVPAGASARPPGQAGAGGRTAPDATNSAPHEISTAPEEHEHDRAHDPERLPRPARGPGADREGRPAPPRARHGLPVHDGHDLDHRGRAPADRGNSARPRAFLTLTIGHKPYGLTVVGDTFTLERGDGQVYEITRGDDPACSCKDFEMRHRGLPTHGCKHIRALRDVDLLPPVPVFPEAVPLPEWADDLAVARFFGMSI